MKKLFLLTVLFVAVGLVQAQNKVTFRYNPTIGEKVNYLLTMSMDIEGEQSMIMDMTMKMFQKANGKEAENFALSAQIEAIKVEMNMGMMVMSYDSENSDGSDPIAQQLGQQFESILKKDINIKMNEKAEVVNVEGGEGLAALGDVKTMFSSTTFPDHAIAEGETWEFTTTNAQMGIDSKYIMTYVGKEDGLLRVNLTTDPNVATEGVSLKASGYSLYDPKTFIVVKSEITSNISAGGTEVTNKVIMQKQ